MTDRRRGLGRGLGALIPTVPVRPEDGERGVGEFSSKSPVDVLIPERSGPTQASSAEVEGLAPVAGAFFAELAVDRVAPNARQPRQIFDEDAMQELVTSIQEVGLLQPVVVRDIGGSNYELIMGERRWRASQLAGLATIPAIVRATDDEFMLRDALLENLHRSQLNPLEEAAAYDQMLQDFGCSHEELAARIGRSRPQISNTLRLLKLPPTVQRRLAAGVLSAGHARALLSLPSVDAQEAMAGRIVAEGLSVRTVEELATLGTNGSPAPKERKPNRPTAPRLAELANRLSDRLETRVKIELGQRKGKVTVEFATLDDLERILGNLDPTLARARLPATEATSMGLAS